MVIVLMGYMGSGKSVLGNDLAYALQFEFIDLDAYIESREGKNISAIFKDDGELYFRRAESKYLAEILNDRTKVVLALGGGTPCYGTNLNLIKSSQNTISIYLKATIETLLTRLSDETAKRPLVAHLDTQDERREFIGKHLFERSGFYQQADITLETDKQTVEDSIENIIFQLF
ncbi:MAG: shikimate kinase [Flavobacteriaceae bacterium]|nr:shikimate kinase [Flavobacteriaceae bacterium]NNK72710.1 shikimate kinase [Flavobacteriaceae bacterium]